MKTALISVSDKTGLLPLAKSLIDSGYRIISTGGTARYLTGNGCDIEPIENVTKFPEILNGRVKTLHPHIMGGILADTDKPEHIKQLNDLMIRAIDIVVVNLYPFDKVFAKNDVPHKDMIENIDIGGVTLLRAAAKNYQSVTVLSRIEDYSLIEVYLHDKADIPESFRLNMAVKAFQITSEYDGMINEYLQKFSGTSVNFVDNIVPQWNKSPLRYGENPHQSGFLLTPQQQNVISVIHGKELSYNNYLDIDASLQLIVKFAKTTAAIIKHTNPCGVAGDDDLATAYQKAFSTDTQSPFGGIVVVNRKVDLPTAEAINKIFTEIVIAPEYEEDALSLLTRKKMRRLVSYDHTGIERILNGYRYVSCLGGLLSQKTDYNYDDESEWHIVTAKKPEAGLMDDLRFAWKVVSALKSNAICLAKDQKTTGLGMGQTSRIDSMELAVRRADKFGHNLKGNVCASDGFFPFSDSIDELNKAGVTAIIQPGGSKGDNEVIEACNKYGIAMIFTGMRHFAH